MKHLLVSVALIAFALLCPTFRGTFARADAPKPSLYPKSWELKFEHQVPKRVVVQLPNTSVPQPYWYMTYTVTNLSSQEQMWLPSFDMMLKDGRVVRSDL